MGRRASIKPLPSRERLRELLAYDEETGALTWRIHKGPMVAGKRAGTVGHQGWRMVRVDTVYYLAHRLIWKIMTGRDPEDLIDHINGCRDDNSWANLRAASMCQNKANSRSYANNTSGHKGVSYSPRHRKFRALVTFEKKTHHIGYFDTIEIAAQARIAAAEKIQGEFARTA